MKQTGNIPNFMKKYSVPRYGTSYEAEHRRDHADEFGNQFGQVFSEQYRTQVSNNSRWTIRDSFDWYIFSNLGFIGQPGTSTIYEEVFIYNDASYNGTSAIFG